MLNTEVLLTKMLEHFPKWMDIRKRAKTSAGGQLVEAVAEETAALQEVIEEFKKDFFIETYFGKEEDIVDFVYKLQVGSIDINVLEIVSHNLTYTDNLNVFYKQMGVFYYEQGYLFFKIKDIGDSKIEYTLNDYYFVEQPEKMHVWNIFDEFATFVGIERHEWETNQQLENRILNVFKEKTNSSEDGLRHAIMTELMEIDASLVTTDIKIEGVTPENLRKKYDEFNTVLDKLGEINKDCYKYKKWDVDPWFYNISSIDYIPHAWDVILEAYKDGVGKTNDLSIVLSDTDDTTDASVLFYKKNIAELDAYLKNKNIKTNVEYNLVQYNEELKPVKAIYKITASKANDITNENIVFQYSDVSHSEGMHYVQDFINTEDGIPVIQDMEVQDFTLLKPNKRFKLKFQPRQGYKSLKIKQCDLVTDGVKRSLLQATQDFDLINGQLIYKHCKKYASKINDFAEVVNMEDTLAGLAMQTSAAEAKAILNIDNLGLERIAFQYGCELSSVPHNRIKASNFVLENNEYVSFDNSGDTKLEFEIQANQIKFKAIGHFRLEVYKDGELFIGPFDFSNETNYSTASFKTHNMYKVVITSLNNLEKLRISNISFSDYEVKETLKYGDFSRDDLGIVLPNIKQNELTISLKSYFDKSPYIEYVYIGAPYSTVTYETPIFETTEDTHLYIKQENLIADLIVVDESNEEDLDSDDTIKDYSPYIQYKALSSYAYIELSLKRFVKINKIYPNAGLIRTTFKNGEQVYIIEFKKDDIINSIFIDGVEANNVKNARLIDLFNVDIKKDKLYVTNLYDGFIVEKDDVQSKHQLSDIEEIKNAFKYGVFNFKNLPLDYNQVFIRDLDNDSIVVSNSGYHGAIKNATIRLKDKQVYVAYNEHKMIQQKKIMLQIEDTFNPFIPQNVLYFYEITSMTESIKIQFHDYDEFIYQPIFTNSNWAVGKKYICLEMKFDFNDSNNYLSKTIKINKEYNLEKNIAIDYMMELDNGSTTNLCKYVIRTPEQTQLEYVTIDPNQTSIEVAPHYYGVETMFKQIDGFNKLSYCNIDQILEFTAGRPDAENIFRITEDMYALLPEEGIIVWSDDAPSILDYEDIYIKYTIKIPINLILDDDLLYTKTNNIIEGYSFIKRIDNMTNLKDNDFVDLSHDATFNTADRTIVHCTNPNFDAYIEPKGIRFKRSIQDAALFAKSGYYYIDGLEYYMFAQETSERTDKVINVEFGNTTKDEEGIHLQKSSNNYINNSLLYTEGIGNVFSKDFVKDSNIFGASSLNAVTACNSFNHWKNVGSNLSLVEGHNGVGINIIPFIKDGYAYVNISDSLYDKTLISFYYRGNLKGYIGKERKHGDLKYPNADSIELLAEIKPTISNNNIMTHVFEPVEDYNYYLVVKGNGLIDDIIVCDEKVSKSWDYHKKNISTLGLEIQEQIIEDFVNRLFFYNTKGYKNLGAEIDNNNTIVNSSLINWGLTKIKEYDVYDDWNYCELINVNIENNMIVSKSVSGHVLTEPIFTGDLNMLKSLTIKVNDVEFEQTSGFITTVYACDEYNGVYELRTSFKDNIGVINEKEIKRLGRYIKIKIDLLPGKIINNLSLFAEYKESENATPSERISTNGQMLSEIYDAQYQVKYKLTDINIDKISNISDVQIQIRASRINKDENVWTEWKTINLDDNLKHTNEIVFDNYRFFQLRVSLKRKEAFVKINYFDLKVVR